jgi:hypothetical protein
MFEFFHNKKVLCIGERIISSINYAGKSGHVQKMKLDSYLIPYVNINPKCIKYVNKDPNL